MCWRGRGRHQRRGGRGPPSLTIYREPRGAPALGDGISWGAAAKGGALPPKASGGAPFPRVPNPRRRGAQGGAPAHYGLVPLPTSAHGALRDGWPHPLDPRDPSGGPGTIPVTPETFPMAETRLPIYNSLPPDHSETPRDVRDLIRDSEQHLGYCIYISLQP